MTSGRDIQILVVGGGVGGLSLARFLQRAGLDPVVIEPAEPADHRRGSVELWPDAVEMLDRLGVGRDVRQAGTAVTTWTRRQPDGTVVSQLDAGDGFGFVAIESETLRTALRESLNEGSVHSGATLQSLDARPGGVSVELVNGVREQFDVVVGADGVRSLTRELVGGSEPAFCGTTSVVLSLGSTQLDGAGEVWTPDGAVFRAVPTPEPVGWLTLPTSVPGQGVDDADALAELCPAVEWLLPDALDAADPGDLWWADDFRAPADVWADGRVALLGDAAHGRHRLTGVGPTLALEDAAVLAEELLAGEGPPAARLADYAARRRSRLDRLGRDGATDAPLAGVDSVLADRLPSVPGVRGARLASCFGHEPPAPAVGSLPMDG